ncbi:MAG TPA: xanthine dehydrogenase family protein subunit M [Candidatus Angelobacter sp.]|jgi:carbon-monoxide dehydrogenase medium subunit|nr:xanthine dehydrogenase family protein subunit M [Candidatus Angelobacter sp.]
MIPAAFDYHRPTTLDQAVALLAKHGEEAKLLAGGHSLLPMMRLRLARPASLVDLGGLRGELSYVRDDGASVAIGAMTRHHDVASNPVLRQRLPLLARAASTVGDPQVRHRGTLAGALAHADPAADLPAVALTLDAVLVVRGPSGEREIAAADFFIGFFESALQPDEVVREVRFPVPNPGHGFEYLKFSRRAQDWAMVGVAALVERAPDGTVSRAAVGLTNMGATPLRAIAVEQALTGTNGDASAVAAAAEHAADGTSPAGDLAASAEYRRHLARVLTRRALDAALRS